MYSNLAILPREPDFVNQLRAESPMFDFESETGFVCCPRPKMLEVCDIAFLGLMLDSAQTCFQPHRPSKKGEWLIEHNQCFEKIPLRQS